jgi:hypothetical protein
MYSKGLSKLKILKLNPSWKISLPSYQLLVIFVTYRIGAYEYVSLSYEKERDI